MTQEQTLGALGQDGAQTSADATSVTEAASQAVISDDLSTLDGVRKAAEKNPALRKALLDAENAAAQRERSRMRREQGSQEAVQAYHQRLVDEIARRVQNGEDISDLGKETPLIAKANQETIATTMFKGLFEQAKALDPDAVAPLESILDLDELTPENWEALSTAAINAVTSKTKKTAINDWLNAEDEEFPTDSKRYKALEERLRKQMESELKARQVEGKVISEQAPPIPQGTSSEQITRTSLEGMTSDARMALILNATDEERARLWEIAMS